MGEEREGSVKGENLGGTLEKRAENYKGDGKKGAGLFTPLWGYTGDSSSPGFCGISGSCSQGAGSLGGGVAKHLPSLGDQREREDAVSG